MEYRTLVDSTRYVAESMKEVSNTFWEALALVVAIMYLFLRDPRATIIAVLTIPVSLIATFAAFKIAGFSINTLTLFAMVLAIGMVVDDAIVVIESVEQHLEKGGGILEATTAAMKEVESPVLATTFVLAAVFIPVAFLSGMTGILYRQFALTIVIAISLSTFVALSLTPALCVMLIRAKSTADFVRPVMTGTDQNENSFFARFERGLDKVRRAYLKTLTVVMRRAFAVPVCVALLAAGAATLWKVLPSEFIPTEDQGYFMVNLSLPEGASMNRTIESIKRFSAELGKDPDIRSVLGIGGFDLMADGAMSSAGVLFVPLKDWGDREKSVDEIMENVEEVAFSVPEASVIPINPPSLPGLSYNHGARDFRKIRRIFRFSLRIVAAVGAATFLLSLVVANPVVALFAEGNEAVFRMAAHGFRLFAVSFLFVGFNIYASSFFTALNDGRTSALLSFCHTLVFLLGMLLFLPQFLGINGVWLANPVAEILALNLAFWFLREKGKVYGL